MLESQEKIVNLKYYFIINIYIDIKETEEAKQRAYTSFGRLILADEINEPIWSLGKDKRFSKINSAFNLPESPGPIYSPPNEEYYKFRHTQKWRIGNSKRPPLNQNEKYDYYDLCYTEKDDLSNKPKKWNKIRGGAISLEPRIKYDYRETVPGPGRYDPNHKLTKPHGFTYIMGEKYKTLTLNLLTGTDNVVGPGKYDIVYSMNDLEGKDKNNIKNWGKKLREVKRNKYTSIHQDAPIWSIGKDKRKGLFNKTWTKNETYEIYSCVGDQIRTHKRSEPKINIGKATRETEKIRGVFANTMSRIPTKVYIPLPKI